MTKLKNKTKRYRPSRSLPGRPAAFIPSLFTAVTLNRYTNKRRQQSILPEGARGASISLPPQIGSISTDVHGQKANGCSPLSSSHRLSLKTALGTGRPVKVHCSHQRSPTDVPTESFGTVTQNTDELWETAEHFCRGLVSNQQDTEALVY